MSCLEAFLICMALTGAAFMLLVIGVVATSGQYGRCKRAARDREDHGQE